MKVTWVTSEGGEWCGIYVDGVLKDEGHSLSETMVLEALGIKFRRVEYSDEQMEDMGRLPEKESELPKP